MPQSLTPSIVSLYLPPALLIAGVAYMDIGRRKRLEQVFEAELVDDVHDCMDAGGRTNQETESRSPNAEAAKMA